MGSYLAGADIHDFLACLGKHVLEKVSFGFSNLEPECPKVFVEDTDEYAQCADAFRLPNKEKKEAAPDRWGESIQKEDSRGWNEEPTGEVNKHVIASDTGWEIAETHLVEGDGWGDKQVVVQDVGWDQNKKNDVDKANPTSCEGGWGSKEEADSNDGWGSFVKSDINMTDPAAQTGNQDSMEGQNSANATSKGGFMHPSRRSRITVDSIEDPGTNERQSGNFAPSGTNTVPLRRRKRFGTAELNAGLTDDKHCENTSWGAAAPSMAGDDSGWGGINHEETTDVNATQQGSSQDNWAEMPWEKPSSEKASQSSKNDSINNDAWQTLPESETSGGDGWGNDNAWNCKGNVENYETAAHLPTSWDAMEGEIARKGSKRSDDMTQRTEKQNADERRSGKFAPSGSNSVPLGKRRLAMNPNVSNDEPESMMTTNTQSSGGKDDKMGWVNPEQAKAVQDFGWDNSNSEGNGKCRKSFQTRLGKDGWGSDAEWGLVSTEGMDNERMAKCDWSSKSHPEASADLNDWGSDAQTANNVDNDGWGDIKLDSPFVPSSRNLPKGLSSSWDSRGFQTCDTQPSKGFVEQDGTPRPRKKLSRGSFGDSWAGFAAKSPQSQSRRPRLRSLLNSPEYSELDELYKAANKILHHNEYQLGDKLNPEDEKFILEKILIHHQDKEEKMGCGVDYVMIDSHAEHQVSCFWVVRKDGTKTDFSYWKCLERLYEIKYSQVGTMDGAKDETNDPFDWGMKSKASSKSDADVAKGSSHVGWGSGGPVKASGDKGKTKGSWNMGSSSADPSETMPDQEEAKQNWDTGASSIKGVNQREAATSTKELNDQGDEWDTWADPGTPTKSKRDQGHAEGSWDVGVNSAVNISEQATGKDVPQEVANDGWGSF